jgi:hypothetical protein
MPLEWQCSGAETRVAKALELRLRALRRASGCAKQCRGGVKRWRRRYRALTSNRGNASAAVEKILLFNPRLIPPRRQDGAKTSPPESRVRVYRHCGAVVG